MIAPMKTYPCHNLSISIERSPEEVYEYVHDTGNLPKWAAGLKPDIKIMMTEKNKYGVLDHTVILADGARVFVPMKVCANNKGSEVIFTLYQLPGMSGEQFMQDMELVRKDLQTLKGILEN